MLDYDFCKLNDKEFEAFCVDLLSNHLGHRLERFKPGSCAWASTQAELFCYAIERESLRSDDHRFLGKVRNFFHDDLSQEEFETVSELIVLLAAPLSAQIVPDFIHTYVKVWCDGIKDSVDESGTLEDVFLDEEVPKAHTKVKEYVKNNAAALSIAIPEAAIDKIAEACDIMEIIEGNRQRSWHSEGPSSGAVSGAVSDEISAIHDLFDRS